MILTDQVPYEQLLNWFTDMARGQGAEVSSLRVLHEKYAEIIRHVENTMASQRVEKYNSFMKRAISHKSGQLIHRILKRMPDTMARPVSKKMNCSTEDQDHANEQIRQWAKVWDAEVDDGTHLNADAWRNKSISPNMKNTHFIKYTVTKQEINRFRTIICSFSAYTAQAHDKLSPKLLDHIDDETLR